MQHPKRILICPLDWGLGHATRCIPIIRELLENGLHVVIAGEGRSLELLKTEFPSLAFIELHGYNITYPEKGSMILKMLFSIPKLIHGIKQEHQAIQKIVIENKIDVVISDNRYGCYASGVKNIFVTHQLMIKAPFLEGLIHNKILSYIKYFDECWIPDNETAPFLSGDLSHKYKLSNHAYFIGPLSRFSKINEVKKFDITVIISGPEPQRTIFEKLIIAQIKKTDLKTLIVQGKPEEKEEFQRKKNIFVIPHLNSRELESAILASDIVISRSGYSTIMDLAILNKKAIFIPTPGQTEQEYLAEYLKEKGIAYFQEQSKFDLNEALKQSEKFTGFTGSYNSGLKAKIESILSSM
ncbi:MAG: glycosyl transferase family 28 [Bacteroidota bacterium]|jgi:uncharacterized protein (TIGR00661 family)|nr:glycosyl transferase family 28 [Bacteroidota bacterium]